MVVVWLGLGQLGGLASLAGVPIGEGSSSEAQIAQEVMKSWSLSKDLSLIIGSKSRSMRLTAGIRSPVNCKSMMMFMTLRRKFGCWRTIKRVSWRRQLVELFVRFSEMLSVSQDSLTGLVSVSIEYYSPQIAKEWLISISRPSMSTCKSGRWLGFRAALVILKHKLPKPRCRDARSVLYDH